jgi:hypothetical protein
MTRDCNGFSPKHRETGPMAALLHSYLKTKEMMNKLKPNPRIILNVEVSIAKYENLDIYKPLP